MTNFTIIFLPKTKHWKFQWIYSEKGEYYQHLPFINSFFIRLVKLLAYIITMLTKYNADEFLFIFINNSAASLSFVYFHSTYEVLKTCSHPDRQPYKDCLLAITSILYKRSVLYFSWNILILNKIKNIHIYVQHINCYRCFSFNWDFYFVFFTCSGRWWSTLKTPTLQ